MSFHPIEVITEKQTKFTTLTLEHCVEGLFVIRFVNRFLGIDDVLKHVVDKSEAVRLFNNFALLV